MKSRVIKKLNQINSFFLNYLKVKENKALKNIINRILTQGTLVYACFLHNFQIEFDIEYQQIHKPYFVSLDVYHLILHHGTEKI